MMIMVMMSFLALTTPSSKPPCFLSMSPPQDNSFAHLPTSNSDPTTPSLRPAQGIGMNDSQSDPDCRVPMFILCRCVFVHVLVGLFVPQVSVETARLANHPSPIPDPRMPTCTQPHSQHQAVVIGFGGVWWTGGGGGRMCPGRGVGFRVDAAGRWECWRGLYIQSGVE